MRTAPALALAVLVACGGDDDPCEGVAGACLAVHVDHPAEVRIDQLQLDLLQGDLHHRATTTTGGVVELPVATAVALTTEPGGPVRVDVVVAGTLGGETIGTGFGSTTLGPDQHVSISLTLTEPFPCVTNRLYCGGVEVAGDPDTVYACTIGAPTAHGRCPGECVDHPTLGNTCSGVGGTCIAGGFYCGGDKLDGDPSTVYECTATGTGTNPRFCPRGCVVAAPGSDDDCRP